jgi:hypothetical protein
MHGSQELVTPGHALAVQGKEITEYHLNFRLADKPFTALSKFGIDFLNKFQCSQSPAPILEDISIVFVEKNLI